MSQFFHIKTDKFPILKGEDEEIVNEGMYGKALCIYLQEKLIQKGYEVPSFFSEDWGWWIGIESQPISFGLCIYSNAEKKGENPTEYTGFFDLKEGRQWIWSKFSFVDTTSLLNTALRDLQDIFNADSEIQFLGFSADFPLDIEEQRGEDNFEDDVHTINEPSFPVLENNFESEKKELKTLASLLFFSALCLGIVVLISSLKDFGNEPFIRGLLLFFSIASFGTSITLLFKLICLGIEKVISFFRKK